MGKGSPRLEYEDGRLAKVVMHNIVRARVGDCRGGASDFVSITLSDGGTELLGFVPPAIAKGLWEQLSVLFAKPAEVEPEQTDSPVTGDPVERVVEATEADPACSAPTP